MGDQGALGRLQASRHRRLDRDDHRGARPHPTARVHDVGVPPGSPQATGTSASRHVFIRLAGGVRVETAAGVAGESGLGGRRPRLALAVLATEHDRDVGREELALALWGEQPPRTWEPSLRETVSKVRRYIADAGVADARITSALGCYRLVLPPGTEIDIEVAEHGSSEAHRLLAAGELAAASAVAARVHEIAARPLLPGEHGSWVEARRRSLEGCLVSALEVLGVTAAARRDWPAVTRAAEAILALEPFREDAYRSLMQAHSAAGNRAEALRVYNRCQRLLDDELGTRPSPDIEAHFVSLLRDSGARSPRRPAESGVGERDPTTRRRAEP